MISAMLPQTAESRVDKAFVCMHLVGHWKDLPLPAFRATVLPPPLRSATDIDPSFSHIRMPCILLALRRTDLYEGCPRDHEIRIYILVCYLSEISFKVA